MVEPRRHHRLVVPDVVGLHWENAKVLLEQQGFPTPQLYYTEAYQPEDTVVSQEPIKGQIARASAPVTLHISKQSLVRFLPSAYQSTDSGVDPHFLRRFLWIFQEIFDSVSRRIDRVHEQFSPLTADEDFLPWLAQWVALTLDADWPDVKKRQMIRSSAELYRQRGTRDAIERLLEIFTEVRPAIIENAWPYHGFWIGAHSTIGVDTVVLPPVNLAHCFVVRFPGTFDDMPEEMVARIHQIIRAEKPAHTVYFLDFEGEKKAEDAVPDAEEDTVGEEPATEPATEPADEPEKPAKAASGRPEAATAAPAEKAEKKKKPAAKKPAKTRKRSKKKKDEK